MLSLLIWIPIAVATLLLLVPIQQARLTRWITLASLGALLPVVIHVFINTQNIGYSFEVNEAWARDAGVSYHLGVNRLSSILILLTFLVGIAAAGFSNIKANGRQFYALTLIMIGGLAGAFASLDLFFLYIFHEFALIPTFLLVNYWGTERRRRAAMKITLYLAFGSLILLFGILGVAYFGSKGTGFTFDLVTLKNQIAAAPINKQVQIWIFGALFMGFGVLVSIFPFHTWAPIGYAEGPSLVAMIHAGVIKKFGLYGLFAIAIPLLPEGFQYWKSTMVVLALCNLVYCAYITLQQKDLFYLLAYASVSHMGYAFLALAANNTVASQGFTLFLFAHGLAAALGFGIAGHCRDQLGTTQFSEMGGLAAKIPFTATMFVLGALASCGLPGLANFPAELMIFAGSFTAYPTATILALWTVVLTAVYQLRAVRNIFFGEPTSGSKAIYDISSSRCIAAIILVIALLLGGFAPHAILGKPTPALVVQTNNSK